MLAPRRVTLHMIFTWWACHFNVLIHQLFIPQLHSSHPTCVKDATDTAKALRAKNMKSSTKMRSGKFTLAISSSPLMSVESWGGNKIHRFY